jgi:hypothetical protein
MFFRRKVRPPLSEAARLVHQAVELIHQYWRDRRYMPSAADVKAFEDLETALFRSAAAARRIAIRMERRINGEPEVNEQKWLR